MAAAFSACRRRRRRAFACVLALAVAQAPLTSSGARTLDLEDLLRREAFGAVSLGPGAKWLAVEQRGPLDSAGRYDVDSFNPLFRTRLMIADLARGGPLRPLAPPEPGVGYQLGPFAPDGERIVVYRLAGARWELGIATLATGDVRWLGVTPEVPRETRKLQWRSSTSLLAIAMIEGQTPYDLRAAQAHLALPARWAATARGEAAVTPVGSGVFLADRDRAPPRRLLQIDALTGAARTLAVGDFTDLELSASRRWLALIEAGEDIPLAADRPVQGVYGVAVRRKRLRLLNLASGRRLAPCDECDVLASLLAWAPDRDALLLYVRDDGAPWTAGRLVAWRPEEAQLRTVDGGLRAQIARRPERVSAGWWGGAPLLFGRPAGAPRDDWFRISAKGPARLTGGLAHPPLDGLVVGPTHLILAADGGAWTIDRGGRLGRAAAGPFAPIARRSEGVPDRMSYAVTPGRALAGVIGGPAGRRSAWVGETVRPVEAMRADETLLGLGATGAVVLRRSGGGAEALVWRFRGADRALAQINAPLFARERPPPIAIHHPGPAGEPLVSWLFPPRNGTPERPPPLVVVPYPGRRYGSAPPEIWDDVPMAAAAPLVGRGYAVLVPSLPVAADGHGPAEGLAARLLTIVNAAARQPDAAGRFDPDRVGLWGHSFGGYAVTSAITQTDRFKVAVAIAAPTNLTSFYGQFEPSRRIYPDEGLSTPWTAGWTESLQADMGAPPWADPARYLRNSPLFRAEHIRTPLLLAYGDQDGAHLGQAEELFSALARQGRDAVLLTYWGEGHVFGSPGNLRDLYRRGFAFLDAGFSPRPPSGDPATPTAGRGPLSASPEPRLPAPSPR